MRELIDKLFTSEEEAREYIEDSGWLDDEQTAYLGSLYTQWENKWEGLLKNIVDYLGEADIKSKDNPQYFDSWYPEAILIDAWRRGNGIFYFALEHHDKEAPIALLLGYISDAEIKEYEE